MKNLKFTVIGFYPDTGTRFADTVFAESVEAAETQALQNDESGVLVIVATVLGDVAVDGEVSIRTAEDIDQYGTEEVCRDGDEHMLNYETITHKAGAGSELNVFCLKCGRPGSIVITADDINW